MCCFMYIIIIIIIIITSIIISLDNREFEEVSEFIYLGCKITNKNNM